MSNPQAIEIDRFQYIVHRVYFKGIKCVLVKCGDEYDQWHVVSLELANHVKS